MTQQSSSRHSKQPFIIKIKTRGFVIFPNSPKLPWSFIKTSTLMLICSLSTLIGCVNYHGINSTKKIATPHQFNSTKSLPKQQGNWPDMNWANQFGDQQLALLIQEALAKNPNIDAASARLAAARAMADQKSAALWPNLSWQGQVARGRLSATLFPPSLGGGSWFTLGEFLYSLNYNLDIWGKNLTNLRQAISNEKAHEAETQEVRLTIASSVATTYNQLAYYYSLREVLVRTVEQRKMLNKISMVRLQSGLDTRVQLYQSHNSTANAQTQLANVEGQISLTRQQLGTLLGSGPDRGLSIKAPRLKNANTPQLPENLPLNLLGRRPDIVGARWQVEAATQGVKNAKAQFYPDVNIVGIGGFLSLGIDRLFERASRQYQVGPAISLPIFDGGALRAGLKGQYASYEQAVANYNVTLSNALADVSSQLTTIKSIDKQLVTQRQALYAAERAYKLAKEQYRIGLTSQLVVLDTETSYLEEQQSQVQLITERRSLQIALIKALGGGFKLPVLHKAQKAANCCRSKIIKDPL